MSRSKRGNANRLLRRRAAGIADPSIYDFVDQCDAVAEFLENWPTDRPADVQIDKAGRVRIGVSAGWFWRIVDATRRMRPDATCRESPMTEHHHAAQDQLDVCFALGGGVTVRAILTDSDRRE